MLIFCATYPDIIKFDKKPNEDFFLTSRKKPIFVVADGVTQSHFEDKKYAYPAGARAAAEIFCQTVVEYLENNLEPRKDIMEKAFDLANERIWELNKNEGMVEKLDYVVYDYFDTVGVAGFLVERKLFYGYVGDCGLGIFDKNNKLKFQTKDMVKPAVERARVLYKNWANLDKRERTRIFHKYFRNNPSGKGYGSFSGEKGVKRYYQIGCLPVSSGDLLVFYSDGFVEYLKIPRFVEILRKGDKSALDDFTLKKAREDYERFGTDRTLIAVAI